MRKISSQTPLQQRISLGYPQDLLARTPTKSGIFEDLDRSLQDPLPRTSYSRTARLPQIVVGPNGPNGLNGPNPAEDHGLSWTGPRLRSSGAHWAGKVPGWGPAVYIELGSWRRVWRRVGKAEVKVEIDADMVEEKLEEEAEEEEN